MANNDEEKTEDATPKKIEDTKKEGNVPKSMEVTGAVILFVGSLYLLFFSSHSLLLIKKILLYTYGFIGQEINQAVLYSITYTLVTTLVEVLAPIFILVILFALLSNFSQFGFILNPLKIDLQKLDPIKGLGSLFAFKKFIEAFKLTIKLSIIIIVMVVLFIFTYKSFLAMMDQEMNASLFSMMNLIGYFLATILLIIGIFAIIDFYFTRHFYFKSLKMSKQEIKDEYKNIDGDPIVKSRIRKIQMEMAQKRMMSNVPEADVVITNPTHYAVALKYDNTTSSAPKVIAKGIDFLALKIKEIAKENDIPIIENPALARALHAQLEIDMEIPDEFYKTVAEIFSYVFKLKKNKR